MLRTVGTTDRTTPGRVEVTEGAHGGADSGFTLIEILITVVLIAGGVLAVLQAWRFGIESSDRHQSPADVQNVLTSASERIMDPTFQPWTDPATQCTPNDAVPTTQNAIVAAYQARARTADLPDGWNPDTITVVAVEYWNGGTTGDVWGPVCYERSQAPAIVPPLRMYQITLSVESPDGKADNTLQVVKSSV